MKSIILSFLFKLLITPGGTAILIQYSESSRALFFFSDLSLADKIKYAEMYDRVLY